MTKMTQYECFGERHTSLSSRALKRTPVLKDVHASLRVLHAWHAPRALSMGLCVLGISFERKAFAEPSTLTTAQGYEYGEMQHPRGLAMGASEFSSASGTGAVLSNPANMQLSKSYHIEGAFTWNLQANRQNYLVAVSDSITNRVAGGLAVSWSHLDPQRIDRSYFDARIATGFRVSDRIFWGSTMRFVRVSQDHNYGYQGEELPAKTKITDPLVQEFTFDSSLTLLPFDGARLSAVGRNLSFPGHAVLPTSLVFGAGYDTGVFSFDGALGIDFHTFADTQSFVRAGAELILAQKVPLRVGYRYDNGLELHALSFGAAYIGEKFAFEVALRRDLSTEKLGTTVSFGLQVFVESKASLSSQEASNL